MFLCMLETGSDKESFEKLYKENVKKLYHIARKIVRNDADAEDAVHNGFVKMAEKYEKYRYLSYIDLVRLCTTVVKHSAYDITRKYKKEGEYSEENFLENVQDILEELIKKNEKITLVQAIMELPDDERELLYHYYVINLKPREIAELLNVSSSEIRKKIFNSKNKLAKILQEKEN